VAIDGLRCLVTPDGNSWRDPEKFKRHVEAMEQDVAADPKSPRLRYYLAQSYRDAGKLAHALLHYQVRTEMEGGSEEETWHARLRVAQLHEVLGHDRDIIVTAYLEAHNARKTRAEALFYLSRYLRLRGEPAAALPVAELANAIPRPNDRLFIERSVYQWRVLDELSLAAHFSDQHDLAARAVDQLLQRAPEEERLRVESNAQWMRESAQKAREALGAQAQQPAAQ
jgi:hypothetical protein